jgi:hypothetical protein
MNRIFVVAIMALFCTATLAAARETNPAVLADYHKHQARKKHKHHQSAKKHNKVERIPTSRIRNCEMRRRWVSPNRIREVKYCEVTP